MASAILNYDTLSHVNLTDDQFSFFAFVKYNSASFLAFLDVNINEARSTQSSLYYDADLSDYRVHAWIQKGTAVNKNNLVAEALFLVDCVGCKGRGQRKQCILLFL